MLIIFFFPHMNLLKHYLPLEKKKVNQNKFNSKAKEWKDQVFKRNFTIPSSIQTPLTRLILHSLTTILLKSVQSTHTSLNPIPRRLR